jgi:hypothetical protein
MRETRSNRNLEILVILAGLAVGIAIPMSEDYALRARVASMDAKVNAWRRSTAVAPSRLSAAPPSLLSAAPPEQKVRQPHREGRNVSNRE